MAPFRISFEMPSGERRGIVAYAFLANRKVTKNRPDDEHRFQVKYGSDDRKEHALWQDEFGLYTTLFVGINPEAGYFVGADPVLHSPTRFFKSIEYKDEHVERTLREGWTAWERERHSDTPAATGDDGPIAVLVGGTSSSFLRYVLFERAAQGLDQGHRHLLAERLPEILTSDEPTPLHSLAKGLVPGPEAERLHSLASELALSEREVLDLIESAPRLKMAVRGWVAEEHLVRALGKVSGVTDAQRIRDEGAPDVSVRFEGRGPILIECKNVLRRRHSSGFARLDFQRTRASKSNPCSRYYETDDFQLVAACLHAVEERWSFRFADPRRLDAHPHCEGRITHRVQVDDRWTDDAARALREVAS